MTSRAWYYAAAAAHGFRPRRTREDEPAYFAALIKHVASRDLAAAHELRVGRLQAEWTAADVDAFQTLSLEHWTGPRDSFRGARRPKITEFEPQDRWPPTDDGLKGFAECCLDFIMKLRRETPTAEVPIFAGALLDSSEVLMAAVGRDDRLATIKLFVRTRPVFGWVVASDAFIHTVTEGRKATKQETILAQVGSRTLRLVMARPYHRVGGQVIEDPPIPDIDLRAHGGQDAYAEVFVSVPPRQVRPA